MLLFGLLLSEPARIVEKIGSHWSIESGMHSVLGVRFGEEGSAGRDKNAAKNWNRLRNMAIQALKAQGRENMKRTMNKQSLTPQCLKGQWALDLAGAVECG